ncbi:unnamed protein product [Mucor circinelloides]|uniref:RRM domain-containing protein n=1 Tax=Mucor circinelloides f. circinelloides (strain 1006PhL) TaxID=1220926 RepID=S2JX01_MUCC1|nr:hypothetical protein HMPREF1544_05848 [Mucor circinelloides 1006PhL]
MASTLKAAATQATKSTITPTRAFFRVSENIPSVAHAREIFKTLGSYGDMVEYKLLRCPETFQYLRYGFVVYKNNQDAQKAMADQFIKVQSELFDKPLDVKVEKSVNNNNNRRNNNKQQRQQQQQQ